MKIVFVVNNKNDRLAKVIPGLKAYCQNLNKGDVQFLFTEQKKHAIDLARMATENGCDYLIAVGGDGTLHELVNGIMQANVAKEEYPIIGLLPYGSANDFARTAGVSKSVEALFELMEAKSIQTIDLGCISLPRKKEIRYFINIAGVGLGPEVVQSLEQTSSVLGPSYNYFKHIIKGFIGYDKKVVTCTTTNWKWKGKLLQMAVANGRFYGNAICTAPDALLDDGQFQIAIFGDLSIWDYLKNLKNLKNGVKINHPEVNYHNANKVLIESDELCGIEADGEFVGHAPATISVLPKAVRFLLSSEVASIRGI